jgi:hypothetical protein
MALGTYTQIKEAIADWLDRGDLDARIPDFIRLAELRVYRELRVSGMEFVSTVTSTAGTNYITKPTDSLEIKSLVLKGDVEKPLKRVSYRDQPKSSRTGIPSTYSSRADSLILYPAVETTSSFEMVYYKNPGSIVDDSNGVNWFTENAPDLLLYGALLEASPYLKDDDRINIWRAAFVESMDKIQSSYDRDEWSGSGVNIVTTSGNY